MTSTPSPTTTPSLTTTPTTAATAPAKMDHRPMNPVDSVGPPVLQASASSTSSVALPVSTRSAHRRPRTPDQMSPSRFTTNASGTQPAPTAEQHSALVHDIGHVVRTFCLMWWKSWKVMPEEVKNTTNYNFDAINKDMLAYLNRLFSERYKQWKIEEGCPNEFEDLEDSWVWLCSHFQEPGYMKTKANKNNKKKKALLHHSGLRPFSYMMEARQKGSKFPEINIFVNIYVRPGDELTQSLHESTSQLPPDTLMESVDPPEDASFAS
ncbi:hypothetical protein ACFX1X_043900 [Malus domestica]